MKRVMLFLMILCLAGGILAGCSDLDVTHTYSLAEEPIAGEKILPMTEETLTFKLVVPAAGYIKMLAYDNTEYEIWPEETVELIADFRSADGRTLYENISITEGYIDKYRFEPGEIQVDITCPNRPAEMSEIAVSWAYAQDSDAVVEIEMDGRSAAVADENGVARFSIDVTKDALISIAPDEACIYESSCSFYVENVNGERMTDDIQIEGTEWVNRQVFLPKGTYNITVTGIEAVASCYVGELETYDHIRLSSVEGQTLPVLFGFTTMTEDVRKATFVPDEEDMYLEVDANGVGTYYDMEQEVEIIVTDASGNAVIDEICEGCTRFDISNFSGEYTVTLKSSDSCVVKLSLCGE